MATKDGKQLAISPGETIKEQLSIAGMSKLEFAARMRLSSTKTRKLLSGKLPIDSEIAIRLEQTLGIPSHFWLNLESLYRARLAA